MKLSQGRFILDMESKFFTQRVVEHWKRLPSEVITTAHLTELKKWFDNALRHMARLSKLSCTGASAGLSDPGASPPT